MVHIPNDIHLQVGNEKLYDFQEFVLSPLCLFIQ